MKILASLATASLLVANIATAEVSPASIDGATTVSIEAAADLFGNGVKFVDVRKPADVELGRIPGAIHLDSKTTLSEETLAEHIAKTEPVVFYCNGHSCMRSSQATEMAVSWGYTSVHYLRDGFPEWQASGLPVE